MADIERRVDQLKKLKYPSISRQGGTEANGVFESLELLITDNKVRAIITGGSATPSRFSGTAPTVDAAIAKALKTLAKYTR